MWLPGYVLINQDAKKFEIYHALDFESVYGQFWYHVANIFIVMMEDHIFGFVRVYGKLVC